VITTTGSWGECHTLLWDEFVTLTHETLEVAKTDVHRLHFGQYPRGLSEDVDGARGGRGGCSPGRTL